MGDINEIRKNKLISIQNLFQMHANNKKMMWAALAVVGVGGGSALGYLAWKKWIKKSVVPPIKYAYDAFAGTGMPNPAANVPGEECTAACTSDILCTACVTRSDNPDFCATYHDDPSQSWTYSPVSPQTLHVKRFSTDPKLEWTDWGDCSQPCGRGTKKRVCSVPNKCPGPTSDSCNTQECDMMFSQASNTKPYPDQKGSESDVPLPMNCTDKCLGDPACTGVIFRRNPDGLPTPIHCITFSDPIDEIQPAPEEDETTAFQVKAPPGTSGNWSTFPSCPCGTDKVERACMAPSGTACGGPKYLKCPNVPCAYDDFPGTGMQGV